MPNVKLDSAEPAEMLQFLDAWPARDPARLAAPLEQFVGNPAYGLPQLRGDLERIVLLLGRSDGEPLFGPRRAVWLPLSRGSSVPTRSK